jgi:hypothetical protein
MRLCNLTVDAGRRSLLCLHLIAGTPPTQPNVSFYFRSGVAPVSVGPERDGEPWVTRVPFSHVQARSARWLLAVSSTNRLRLLVLAPLPKGRDAFAEHSTGAGSTGWANAAAGGLGNGSQAFAHPDRRRDAPIAARFALRIVSAPGPLPMPKE